MADFGRKPMICLRAKVGPDQRQAEEAWKIPSCICDARANMGKYRTAILSLMRLRVRRLPLEGV